MFPWEKRLELFDDWDSNEQRKNCLSFRFSRRRRRNCSWQLWKLKQLRRNPSGNCVILFFSGQKPCIPFEPTHYNIGFSRPRISLIWTSGFRILKLPLCGYLRTSFRCAFSSTRTPFFLTKSGRKRCLVGNAIGELKQPQQRPKTRKQQKATN